MNYKVLITSIILVALVSLFGSQFTDTGNWYESIKPSITPPDYIFPIIWTILYVLIALSLYFAWTESKKKYKTKIAILFGINLIANAFWSILFFGMKNPLWAFYDIIIIEASLIGILIITWKTSKKAFYLLIPYLLWVSFAAILNYLMI